MGIFKAKNAKDWKTTVLTIIGGLVMLAGILYPDKVTDDVKEGILSSTGSIITGIGALIPILVGIFGSKDGDK
jgi:hypothetical protein